MTAVPPIPDIPAGWAGLLVVIITVVVGGWFTLRGNRAKGAGDRQVAEASQVGVALTEANERAAAAEQRATEAIAAANARVDKLQDRVDRMWREHQVDREQYRAEIARRDRLITWHTARVDQLAGHILAGHPPPPPAPLTPMPQVAAMPPMTPASAPPPEDAP